jgi:integrase
MPDDLATPKKKPAKTATRRTNGEGTITPHKKDSSGKVIQWKGAISLGYGTDGKLVRRWAYGSTTKEVSEKLDALKTARNTNLLTTDSAGDMTFGAYLLKWLEHTEEHIKHKTFLTYHRGVHTRLIPILGKKKLEKLTPLDIENALRQMKNEHNADDARRTRVIAGIALNQAVRWQLVPRNVCSSVRAPKVVRKEMQTWTPKEAVTFLETARLSRWHALFVIALGCGLRSGELLGLRWKDVDTRAGWLKVEQQLLETNQARFGTPKWDSVRRIKLSDDAMNALEHHRRMQQTDRAKVGARWRDFDLVFPTGLGSPLSASNLRSQVFVPLILKAGVKRIRIHDLRHTAATAMIRNRYPAKIVSDILGHRDPGFTLKEYAHVWDEFREEFCPSVQSLYYVPSSVPEAGVIAN